jgi:hypothetical protein
MHVFNLNLLLCAMVGAFTGGNVGRHFGLGWLLLGTALGFAIGVASVFIFTFPYVYLQIRMESRSAVPREWSPPLWWLNLYFLVIAGCVMLAGIGSWWAVRVIGGAAAG